jgi:hypothetical protein
VAKQTTSNPNTSVARKSIEKTVKSSTFSRDVKERLQDKERDLKVKTLVGEKFWLVSNLSFLFLESSSFSSLC